MTKTAKITFWSDSTTVLHWIHQTSFNYKAFVGNRVSEIHTIMSNLETAPGAGAVSWRYVACCDLRLGSCDCILSFVGQWN